MEVLYERCAGLDVHKKTVKACLLTPGVDQRPAKAIRTYGTKTADLLELRDWLKTQGCTHLAMESTGVYWKPIYNLLEGDFEVRARHCSAHQNRAWAQNGREGRRMDRRSVAAWAGARQLHSLGSAAGIA